MSKVCKKMVLLIMALGITFLTPDVLIAGDKNPYEIRPINPPPSFGSSKTEVSADGRNHYDITGPLDAINNQRMVVGDTEIKIAPNVAFHNVTPGNFVSIRLNDEGQVAEVTDLHQKIKR